MSSTVLVHGGGFDARCWDLLVPLLDAPVLAVDLPGRGAHPADLGAVTIADCADSIVADVDAAGFDEVVLVGHSLAGCTMPATIGRLEARVRHAVFVAATVPEDGTSSFDTLEPEVQALAASAPPGELGVLGSDLARMLFGNDLDDHQFAWCVQRMVPEAPGLVTQSVDLSPLQSSMPRTWIRPLHDAVVSAEKQLRFAANAGPGCAVVDLDAAHMCMISQPEALAAIVNGIAATVR